MITQGSQLKSVDSKNHLEVGVIRILNRTSFSTPTIQSQGSREKSKGLPPFENQIGFWLSPLSQVALTTLQERCGCFVGCLHYSTFLFPATLSKHFTHSTK